MWTFHMCVTCHIYPLQWLHATSLTTSKLLGCRSKKNTYCFPVSFSNPLPLFQLFDASLCFCASPFPLSSQFLSPCVSPTSSFSSPPLSASRKILTYRWVMCHMWVSYVTCMNDAQLCMHPITIMNAWWHTYEWVMNHMWMSRITHMS